MGKITIDVAQESTLKAIFDKVEEGAGIWCEPSYEESYTFNSNTAIGTKLNSNDGSIIIYFQSKLYMISDNEDSIFTKQGGTSSWITVAKLPYVIDVHETSIVVFNNELHLLGGSGEKVRSHYKWDGETWSVASELPYDFSNGRAIVYQDKIHIIGGGSARFLGEYSTGRLNNHYAWDGESWTKASNLPYTVWGATPFVSSGQLHLIGGGIVEGVNYNRYHYVWDGISWSKATDLPFDAFNVSVVVYSNTRVYVFGGMNKSGGEKQTTAKIYNGTNWVDAIAIPTLACNNTSMGATIDNERNIWVFGSRLYLFANGNYINYQSVPVNFDRGQVVVYRNEVHMFYARHHYVWRDGNWIALSSIPYNFIGGSAIVFKDKIHLLGSNSSGVEDYHYTWSPEEDWELKSNLPSKFSNGSAVIYNDELHIIGGTVLNPKTYNHYKLVNSRWVIVGHTIGGVVGSRCATVYNNSIYAVSQSDDNGGTISKCTLSVFDGVRWSSIGEIDTKVSADNYRYLIVYQNRLHFLVYNNTNAKHYVITDGINKLGNTVTYFDIPINSIPDICVFNGYMFTFSSQSGTNTSIIRTSYAPNNVPIMKVFLPKEHQLICDKGDFLPIIGEVEEVESGFKALSTGEYIFAKYGDTFSIS